MVLMQMLGLNEMLDHSAITNSVHMSWHVLSMEDGPVLRRVLMYLAEGGTRVNRQWMKKA